MTRLASLQLLLLIRNVATGGRTRYTTGCDKDIKDSTSILCFLKK